MEHHIVPAFVLAQKTYRNKINLAGVFFSKSEDFSITVIGMKISHNFLPVTNTEIDPVRVKDILKEVVHLSFYHKFLYPVFAGKRLFTKTNAMA